MKETKVDIEYGYHKGKRIYVFTHAPCDGVWMIDIDTSKLYPKEWDRSECGRMIQEIHYNDGTGIMVGDYNGDGSPKRNEKSCLYITYRLFTDDPPCVVTSLYAPTIIDLPFLDMSKEWDMYVRWKSTSAHSFYIVMTEKTS